MWDEVVVSNYGHTLAVMLNIDLTVAELSHWILVITERTKTLHSSTMWQGHASWYKCYIYQIIIHPEFTKFLWPVKHKDHTTLEQLSTQICGSQLVFSCDNTLAKQAITAHIFHWTHDMSFPCRIQTQFAYKL